MKVKLISIGVIAAILSSCTKNNDSTLTPAVTQNFKWTFGGNTSYTVDSSAAFLYGMSDRPIIVGWNKGNTLGTFKIAFTVTSFAVGVYNLTPTSASKNNLYCSDDNGNELLCINGSLSITTNSSNRISGTFTATVVDTNRESHYLTGSFTDIPVRP